MKRLGIDVEPGEYCVVRLDASAQAPVDLLSDAFVSVTRTRNEVSVVCPRPSAPEGRIEGGWRLLSVRGPLGLTMAGIIAAVSSELAAAGVPIFVLSTFDTDHVLVQEADLERAVQALRDSGHEVHGF